MSVETIIKSIKNKYNKTSDVLQSLKIIEFEVNLRRKTLEDNMDLIKTQYLNILNKIINTDLNFKNISNNTKLILQQQTKRKSLGKDTHFFAYLLSELDNNLYCGFPKDGPLAGFIAMYDHDTASEVRFLDNSNSDKYNLTSQHLNRVATHFNNLLKNKFEFSEFNLSSLCKEVSDFLISSKNPLKCEFSGENMTIEGNPYAVYEALFNIGKNGIYHGNKQIKFLTENHTDYALIKIRDAGTGIDRKDRMKIKQMGVRLKCQGTGYGLGIATYAIETVNNGLITFRKSHDSEYNGNEARIFLPKTHSFARLKPYINIRDILLV